MTNKAKQRYKAHVFRKRKSILFALLKNENKAWELAYEISWEGMRKRCKYK